MSAKPSKRKPDLIIRAGDLVRIVDPRLVLRVGYPKCTRDYLPEVKAKHGEVVYALFGLHQDKVRKDLLIDDDAHEGRGIRGRYADRTLHDLAHLAARADGFGGPDRSLHYSEPIEAWRACVVRVHSVRTVKTGKYYAPWTSRSYEGEWDHENGGLSDPQTWRLATLTELPTLSDEPGHILTIKETAAYRSGEIPVQHLQKMAPCKVCDAKVPADEKAREERLRTIHWITTDWNQDSPGYCARCYYCGTPFEAAS